MPGLVPGIHDFLHAVKQGVDGRDKPGHDGDGYGCQASSLTPAVSAPSREVTITLSSARSTSFTPCPEADDRMIGVFLQAFFSFAVCVLIASGVIESAFDRATISGL